jgi:hypothetical protein
MKQFSLALLACATALAIPQLALGETYSLDYNSPTITLTGTFTLAYPAIGTNPLDYNFASFTGTMVNNNGQGGPSGPVFLDSLGTSTTPGGNFFWPPPNPWGWDTNNQFYPDQDGTAGGISGSAYVDYYGLMLTDSNGDLINIFGDGGGVYTLSDQMNQPSLPSLDDVYGSLTVSPEPSTLPELLLGVLGLAGGLFFKARRSGRS